MVGDHISAVKNVTSQYYPITTVMMSIFLVGFSVKGFTLVPNVKEIVLIRWPAFNAVSVMFGVITSAATLVMMSFFIKNISIADIDVKIST